MYVLVMRTYAPVDAADGADAAAAGFAGFAGALAGALAVVLFHGGGYYVLGLVSAVGYVVASSGGDSVVRMAVLAAEELSFVSAAVV